MTNSTLTEQLIVAFQSLPGIGPKSAQRMAYHLLVRDRKSATRLADALALAVEKVGHCQLCRNLTENDLCPICASTKRDRSVLCVVENAADVQALENSTNYEGLYFVLMGHLSPLDGIGPNEIGMDLLVSRFRDESIREVILATNSTVEGEITANFISDMANKFDIKTTRIAHGVPMGGELEFVDGGTLRHALNSRVDVSADE